MGAAVHIVDPLKVHDTTQLHDLALSSPWAPIGVGKADLPGVTALIAAWRANHRLTGLIVLKADTVTAPHAALHRALRVAKTPSSDEVAEWIHLRTESRHLAATVLAELLMLASPCRQTRHTRFVKAGPLRASGWKHSLLLAQALAHPCDTTIDGIAGALECDVRTLRDATEDLMGMTIAEARESGLDDIVQCPLGHRRPGSLLTPAPDKRIPDREVYHGEGRCPKLPPFSPSRKYRDRRSQSLSDDLAEDFFSCAHRDHVKVDGTVKVGDDPAESRGRRLAGEAILIAHHPSNDDRDPTRSGEDRGCGLTRARDARPMIEAGPCAAGGR